MIIFYKGYSSPKCSCNDTLNIQVKYKSLLKCLHVMDENVIHPSPHLEPSLTPLRMPKLSARNTVFKTKGFFSLKHNTNFSIKFYWTTLRGELLDNSPKQSWVILRDELLDNSTRQFFGKYSHEIHLTTMFFMSCTHTYYSRLPQCI